MPRNDRLQETLSASFGIVSSVASSVAASVAEEVRKGPRVALKLPLMAMSTGVAVTHKVRHDLTSGVQLLRSRFGAEDVQEPFVSAFDRVTEDTRDLVDAASSKFRGNGHGGDEAAAAPEEGSPEAPKAEPTPKRPRKSTTGPRAGRPTTKPSSTTTRPRSAPTSTTDEAAEPEVPVAEPEVPVAEQVGLVPPETEVAPDVAAAAGAVVDHDELPLPDFDHMTLGQLRGRLRSLDLVSLVQLRDYEEAHANRLPIVVMLNNRISKVQESGADTGAPQTSSAGASKDTPTESRVTSATAGPPINPPTGGDPTNPAQPR
jgi:hypothetical protein